MSMAWTARWGILCRLRPSVSASRYPRSIIFRTPRSVTLRMQAAWPVV
ncbi:MAG: hypothetical protein M3533_13365 [Actinomycetota bacterium]|nr:hypothetical protein [Actinomycetota bacterium]MDQ3377862.1 hypothetical protein [Actinomycetota bacterium]